MKASELRIGNLAYNTKGEVDAIDIGALRYLLSYGDTSICQVKPIPLNEDWLLRFGFEKKESSTCIAYHIGINEVTHDWLFDLVWLITPELIGAPDVPFYRNGRHTIQYVHQLQNLYFALTGDELTIKE